MNATRNSRNSISTSLSHCQKTSSSKLQFFFRKKACKLLFIGIVLKLEPRLVIVGFKLNNIGQGSFKSILHVVCKGYYTSTWYVYFRSEKIM